MAARVRCTACATAATVRQVIGPLPAKFRNATSVRRLKDAAAAEVPARLGMPELEDPLSDLWPFDAEAGR
jgi:hypothetical protein